MRLLVALALLLMFPSSAAALDLRLDVQRRAFVGYPIVATAHAAGVLGGESVTLERRAGSTWTPIASTTVHQERGTVVFKLPPGRRRVRLTAVVGGESATSPVRVVKVVRARHWTTSGDSGRYRGEAEGADLELTVARGGRQIRDFETEVSMFCVGPTIPDNHFSIGVAPVKRVKVAPDGRFYVHKEHGDSTVIELAGRVHDGRVKGQVRLAVATCDGTADFSAKLRR